MISKRDQEYLKEFKKKTISKCKKCKGEDYDCDCYKKFRLEIKKVKANIPPKYLGITLDEIDHPDVAKAKKAVIDYIENTDKYYKQGVGLYLYGTSGLGKTLLASIALTEALKKGYTGYFTDLTQCITMLLEGWYEKDKKFNFIDKITESDFLVIDDIGREYSPASKLNETTFDMVFRERANRMLPIIITSTKYQEELAVEYGSRILSLFHEHLLPVEFKGADFRKGILKKKGVNK